MGQRRSWCALRGVHGSRQVAAVLRREARGRERMARDRAGAVGGPIGRIGCACAFPAQSRVTAASNSPLVDLSANLSCLTVRPPVTHEVACCHCQPGKMHALTKHGTLPQLVYLKLQLTLHPSITWHRAAVTSELSLLLPSSERVALQRFAIVWGLVWQICIPCQSTNHPSACVQASLALAPILPVIRVVVRSLTWLDPRSRHHGTTHGMLVILSGVKGLMRRIVVARLRWVVLSEPALQ